MNSNTPNNMTLGLKSSGFIDGYKASNFESNSSLIKYHEEELSELLKLLQDNLFKTAFGENQPLLENYLKKASEKLISVKNYSEAESSYIQSFLSFQSFLQTIKEIDGGVSPSNMLLIKKILNHYKILGEKSLLDNLSLNTSQLQESFLTL